METDKKIETPQDNIDKEIVFKDIEPCRPTSWEEYCEINKRNLSYEFSPTTIEGCYNLFYTKERAKQFVALGKILQLRDYWVKDYEFEDAIRIDVCKEGVIVTRKCDINDSALTFPTREMANEFIDCFEDLLYDAIPLV